MLILNPKEVRFAGDAIEDVTAVLIDRDSSTLAIEWSDMGAHPIFVDSTQRTTTIRIVQDLARGDLGGIAPGDEGELSMHTSPASSDAGRTKVSATVVVADVTHELSRKRGAVRTIRCIAVSPDGQADPITITEDPS